MTPSDPNILDASTKPPFYVPANLFAETAVHEVAHSMGGNDHFSSSETPPMLNYFLSTSSAVLVRHGWTSSGPVPLSASGYPRSMPLAERSFLSLKGNFGSRPANLEEPDNKYFAIDVGTLSRFQLKYRVGVIDGPNDDDWLRFRVTASAPCLVQVKPELLSLGTESGPIQNRVSHSTDTKIFVESFGGTAIGTSNPTGENSSGWTPSILFSATSGSEYRVKVEPSGTGELERYGNLGQYRIEVLLF